MGNELVGFSKPFLPNHICINTIQKLIEIKNQNKGEKMGDILINEELINFIARQNYKLDSILEKIKR